MSRMPFNSQSATVSAIIPTYNCAKTVTEAIKSILAQTVAVFEIFVIDDGSTDNTKEALVPFVGKVNYIYQENSGGPGRGRNEGIRRARGNIIAFLDADDVWHPWKLEFQLRVLADHPEIGALGTQTFAWPSPIVPQMPKVVPNLVFCPLKELLVRNIIATSSVVVRRETLQRAGEFVEDRLFGSEDLDLWLRIADVSVIALLPLPLMGYRDMVGSLSKRALRMRGNGFEIVEKWVKNGYLKRRFFLRNKALAHVYFASALAQNSEGNWAGACRDLLYSLFRYPFPYLRDKRFLFARLGRLVLYTYSHFFRKGQRS